MEYLYKSSKSHRYAIGFFCLMATLLLYLSFGMTVQLIVYSFFSILFVLLSYEDLMGYVLPTNVTYPATFLAIVYAVFMLQMPWLESVCGAILGYASFLFLLWFTTRGKSEDDEGGLGGGDVVLMGLIGGLCGFFTLAYVLVLSTLFVVLIALYTCFIKREKIAGVIIPFGPCLCLAAYITFFL